MANRKGGFGEVNQPWSKSMWPTKCTKCLREAEKGKVMTKFGNQYLCDHCIRAIKKGGR